MWELEHKRRLSTEELMLLNCLLEKTLESPLDCKIQLVHPKGNQPWIFIGRTDAEAESSVPYHMIQRVNSLEKTLMLGKIESRRRRGWQRMRLSNGIIDSVDMSLSKLWEMLKDRQACCASVHGIARSQTCLGDWRTTKVLDVFLCRMLPTIFYVT